MASVSQICCYGSLMNNQDLICWFVLLNLNFTLLNTYIFPNMKFSTLFFGSWTWLFKTICGSGQIHVAPHARVMQVTDFHKSLVSFLNQPFIKKCVAWLGCGTTNSWVRFGEGRWVGLKYNSWHVLKKPKNFCYHGDQFMLSLHKIHAMFYESSRKIYYKI